MKQIEKRVGIFMKVYRNEPTMHQAIKSVLEQTYKNFKYYILVNEFTKSTVQEYADKDQRIELLIGGSQDGFRTYMKYIANENAYVTTIDADDWYVKTYVEQLLHIAEEQHLDIVACSNYYFVGDNKIVGERKQTPIVWEVEKTNLVLPFVYGHFRTIWGKLFNSRVLLECNLEMLPKGNQYGGYGGDTLFVFSTFLNAKRLGVSDRILYYYRISETSSSYTLKEGRLDSDEILFCFVKEVLNQLGSVGDDQVRFLLFIYGYALIDTLKLLIHAQLSEVERIEKIEYVFEKLLTKELFLREATGKLAIPELGISTNFAEEVKRLMFLGESKINPIFQNVNRYLYIFEIIYPRLKGQITEAEFYLLIKNEKILDAFISGDRKAFFEMLAVQLCVLEAEEFKICLNLMQRITTDSILKNILQDKDFTKTYIEVIKVINKGNDDLAIELVKNYFAETTLPSMPELLVNLWNNLAARLENVSEFVFSKQLKVEILILLEKKEEALMEYEELIRWGINDDTMEHLKHMICGS